MARSLLVALCVLVSASPSLAAPAAAPAPTAPGPKPAPGEPVRARILAVGDVLMHMGLVRQAQQPKGEYDFAPLFAAARPWVESADLAIANLEVTLTGPHLPWGGYPRFNTPPSLAKALKDVGFDAVTRANNHVLDYGAEGLRNTTKVLDEVGLPHTGASLTEQERDTVLVLEPRPNLRVALLSYTYGTNGFPLPQPWSVNLLDEERMRADVRRARGGAKADLVVVALHFGTEYTAEPDASQRKWVQVAREAGADVVLGNHPHVVHRAELKDGRAAIYSLGNFVSEQPRLATREGVLLVLDVVKDAQGTRVESLGFVPTWMHLEPTPAGIRKRLGMLESLQAEAAAGKWTGREQDKGMLAAALADVTARVSGQGVVRLPPQPAPVRVAASPAVARVHVPPPTGLMLSEAPAGMQLFLDDVPVKVDASDDRFVRATPGEHHFVARGPGLLEVAVPVRVEPGKLAAVKLFRAKVGADGRVDPPSTGAAQLELSSEPAGAVVQVDGAPVGRTPNTFQVAPGLRTVRLTCPWCEPLEWKVLARPGKPLAVKQSLRVRRGVAVIVPAEAGVRVAVDGVDRGVASPEVKVEPLSPGLHPVTLTSAGGRSRTEAIFVGEGAPTRVALEAVADSAQPAGGAAGLPVTVRFSEPHLAYYAVPTHQVYGPSTSADLFARMRSLSGPTCNHFRGIPVKKKEELYTFMRPEVVAHPPWSGFVNQIVAGCFNFFQMNDVRPDLDFHFAQKLYPNDRKECFSVGFMQPYWMHTLLGCERLTMVDLDWRIHDGHQQMLSQFRAGKLGKVPTFDAALGEVKLGWSARFDKQPMAPETSAALERLCFGYMRGRCRDVLQEFQRRSGEVKSVELQVSALHDASYAFLPGVTPVIFFSNALEAVYTSRPQFDLLMKKISLGLQPGAKAVLLYHAAGRQQFGAYELTPKGGGAYALKTHCKDDYLSSPIKDVPVVPYETWFEAVTETKPPFKPCYGHPLLKGIP
ncbi:MAG: hypothetical protein RL653_882 [Pseudomonadota bacterium]|jgi:poly-gamma-glutamate synthesis protein (capsule biosynthesis protein)